MGSREKGYFVNLRKSLANNIPVSGKTLVEILGRERVIIENHSSILSYEPDRILLKVKEGQIGVVGRGLVLSQIAGDQLVICGQIDGIELLQG